MPTEEVEGEQELIKFILPKDKNVVPISHLGKITGPKIFETYILKVGNT